MSIVSLASIVLLVPPLIDQLLYCRPVCHGGDELHQPDQHRDLPRHLEPQRVLDRGADSHGDVWLPG